MGFLDLSLDGAPGLQKWGNGEISHTEEDKDYMISPYEIKLLETERRTVVTRGWGNWEMLARGYKPPVIRSMNKFWGSMSV